LPYHQNKRSVAALGVGRMAENQWRLGLLSAKKSGE